MKLTAEATVLNDNKLNTNIDTAQTTANEAKSIATDTAQYFWFTSSGSDTGAHISEKTKAQFEASPSGANLLANSNGIAVRDGTTELATFGETVTIGETSSGHLETTSTGIELKYANGSIGSISGSRETNIATEWGWTSPQRDNMTISEGANSVILSTIQRPSGSSSPDDYARLLLRSGESTTHPGELALVGRGKLGYDTAISLDGVSVDVKFGQSASSYRDLGTVFSVFDGGADVSGTFAVVDGSLTVDEGSIKNLYGYNDTVGSATNMYIGTTGKIHRTTNTSSRRYKHDIKDVSDESLDPHNLYDVEVKQFKYNEGMISDKNDSRYGKTLIGFISEQVREHYPIAVDLNEDGECEAWNAQYLIPPMLKLIQEQHEEIEQLKMRVDALERQNK